VEIKEKISWKIKLKAVLWYLGVRLGGGKYFL
jgi:hypothetical protein